MSLDRSVFQQSSLKRQIPVKAFPSTSNARNDSMNVMSFVSTSEHGMFRITYRQTEKEEKTLKTRGNKKEIHSPIIPE
jgi:hypothetical protein